MPRPIPSALRVAAVGLLVVGLPVLYLLGAGPVAKLRDAGVIDQATLETLYAPVMWAQANSATVDEAVVWYAGLWSPFEFTDPGDTYDYY